MFPSSNRVKLNRVALKDVVPAPRRRRLTKTLNKVTADSEKQDSASELVSEKDTVSVPSGSEPGRAFLTHRMGPESATGAPGNTCEGEPEESGAETHILKRRSYVPPCRGEDMEVKQDGPNIRGKYRQSKHNTRSRLEGLGKRCSPRLRGRVDSDHALLEEIHRGVKQSKARRRRELTPEVINRTNSLTRVSPIVRDSCREGQRSVKSAACDPGLVRTGPPSVPNLLSNSDRDSDPNPTGLAGSAVYLRRSGRASHCKFCGDCNNISPRWKTVGKQGPKSSNPGLEPSAAKFRLKKENTGTEPSKKVVVWINQYPKVTLCDIAKKCDAYCSSCSYVLPDFLKTNVVHCFKQDMRTGYRFGPGCLGDGKHKSGESSPDKNNVCCPKVHCEKTVCQCERLTEHQKHLEEDTDAQTSSSCTACHFQESLTSEDCETRSASILQGKQTNKGLCRTGMWDRGVEEDHGPGCDLIEAGICRDKRIKLGNSVGCSSTFGSDNFISKKPCGQRSTTRRNDESQVASELLCHENEADTDEPETFTCQRVRPYFRKINFSCARVYMPWPFLNSGLTLAAKARSAQSMDPSARDNSDSVTVNQNQSSSCSNRVEDVLSNTPTEKQEEDGASILAERHLKRYRNTSSYSDRKHTEISQHLVQAVESPTSLHSDTASFSTPGQHGRKPGTVSESCLLVNGPEINSSMSTPPPSALGLSDWESATTVSPMSSPFTQDGSSNLSATPSSLPPSSFLLKKVKGVDLEAVGKALSYCEATQMTSCISPSSTLTLNSDSSHSCESSLLLCQDDDKSDEELLKGRSPPTLEPYYNTSPFKQDLAVACAEESSQLCHDLRNYCIKSCSNECMLPPVLSPVTSPQRPSWSRSFSHQSSGCSDKEKEEEINMIRTCHMPQIVNGNTESSKDYFEHSTEGLEGVSASFKTQTDCIPSESQSSPYNNKGGDDNSENGVDNKEEESQDETDYEDIEEQGNRSFEQVPLDPQVKTAGSLDVLTETCSSSSSNEDDSAGFSDEGQQHSGSENGSSPSEIAGSKREKTKAEAAGDCQPGILDEFTAYEQDILLVDAIQDDAALFDNLPKQSLLKLGPIRVTEAPKSKPVAVVKLPSSRMDGASPEFKQRLTPVIGDFHCNSPHIKEEDVRRPWRPQCSTTSTETQNDTCPATNKQNKNVGQADANNNHVNGGLERSQPIQTVSSSHTLQLIPPLRSVGTGSWMTTSANITDFIRKKSYAYCRQYFSESLSCGFKMCRFQHLPVEGDEKFCVETVARFVKNPMCLQKAGAVFTGYYQNNPPGVYFSMPVLLTLLWALLKACMVSDVFSVLRVSLAHNIVPSHEFLLALYNFVREKGLMATVPELVQLTFKMASAGLELSLDSLDCVKNTPVFQQSVHPDSPVSVSGNHKLSSSGPFPDYLNLAHAIVEIELCTKQEDWKRMGEAFRYICQSNSNHVERISGRIAIALLSERKDKLSLPFAAFAETVCQNDSEDILLKSFLGRIGVSLMLRYHKTHQWAKGRRVVEMLSMSKVNYSTLKGLFGNEDGASRCCLVTVATELFLLSGSVEGALQTLRENKWFLSSCSWPCVPADLEGRTRVLTRLAEKTSHRDTLEVLGNLPGIKEPNDLIDISRYSPLFNSHLQVCVDRHILPVASDTVDFMLSKKLSVNHTVLQILLHKLGKQNLWLRAREVFRHSLSSGYYAGVSAPHGFMSLIVPCGIGEVELALTFEMFITVNANIILQLPESTTSSLSITLKRTQSCESEYLSAGSRLLSAACIPQPKLIVHYIAVNSSQEQVFTMDISSARRWLRHNHLWANEVWTNLHVPDVPRTT